MRKTIIKFVMLMTLLTVLSVNNLQPIVASSGSIAQSVTSSVVVGKTVTMTVKYTCADGIGGATSYVTYDSNYFKLTAYPEDFNKNNGKLMADATTKTSVTYTFKFTTLKVGSSKIKITTNEFIDYKNGSSVSGYSDTLSKTVTITAKTSTSTSTVVSLSSDASLSALTIANYDIDFDSGTKEYKLYVANDVRKLDIKATAASSKAKISSINSTLQEGWNEIKITCTAENKTASTYVVNVYVDQTPVVWYQYQDLKLGVVANIDLVTAPEGFTIQPITVGDNALSVYVRHSLMLLYVEDASFNKEFYCYDSANDTLLQPYVPLKFNEKIYIAPAAIPETVTDSIDTNVFTSQTFMAGDIELNGWKYTAASMGEFNLVYLQDEYGKADLYQYDIAEKSLQRYHQPVKAAFTNLEVALMAIAGAGVATIILTIIVLAKTKPTVKV